MVNFPKRKIWVTEGRHGIPLLSRFLLNLKIFCFSHHPRLGSLEFYLTTQNTEKSSENQKYQKTNIKRKKTFMSKGMEIRKDLTSCRILMMILKMITLCSAMTPSFFLVSNIFLQGVRKSFEKYESKYN